MKLELTIEEILDLTDIDRVHIEYLRLAAKQSQEEFEGGNKRNSHEIRAMKRADAKRTLEEVKQVYAHMKFLQEQTKLFED